MANEIVVDLLAKTETIEKQVDALAKQSDEKLSKIGSGVNFIALNQGLDLAKKAFGVLKEVGEAALDTMLDGEKIRSFSAQFDLLADHANIAGDALKEGLKKAADGLVSDTDLLQAANKAMVELGEGAAKIPQTLEIARKASSLFGGEVVANFELINQAIATGQTRALRHIGIVIDQEKAMKDFARSLGVSADTLNQAGRQQAIMNAVLEKSKTAFDGVNPALQQNGQAWQRLKVNLTEAIEGLKLSIEGIFGDWFKRILDTAGNTLKDFGLRVREGFGKGDDAAKAHRELLEREIPQMLARYKELKNNVGAQPMAQMLLDEIVAKRKELNSINAIMEAQAEEARKRGNPASFKAAMDASKGDPSRFQDPEKAEQSRIKMLGIMNQSNTDRLSALSDLAQIDGSFDRLQAIKEEQRTQVEEDFRLKREQLDLQAKQMGIEKSEAYQDVLINLEEQKEARILALQKQAAKSVDAIQQAMRTGIVAGLTQAFSAMGSALAKGGNAFQAFAKGIIASLGNLAIQIGSMLIMVGLGFEAAGMILPAWAVAGAGTVAAGIALVGLGGALSAMGSGEGDTGGGVSAGNGGGAGGSSSFANQPAVEKPQPQTNVVVNVHGNILNRREEALYIAEVLNEARFTNGVVLAGAG